MSNALKQKRQSLFLNSHLRTIVTVVLLLATTLLAVRPGVAGPYATSILKIQWRNPSDANSTYQDGVPSHVLTGTRLIFKAIPNPTNEPFPSSKPVWGGVATGTGETTAVTFGALSANLSDYKTITATHNGTVAGNVIVYELMPFTEAQDYFYGRSQARYGVGEVVNLLYSTQPANIGADLIWRLASGNGHIPDGTARWIAGDFAATTTLKAEVNSGPSRGEFRNVSRGVVAPSSIAMSNFFGEYTPRVGHNQNSISVGAKLKVILLPTDVSFSQTEIAELEAPATGTGAFASYTNYPTAAHQRTQDKYGNPVYFGVSKPVDSTSGSVMVEPDRIGYGTADFKLEPGIDPAGSFTWKIPWVYRVISAIPRPERRIGGSNYTVDQVTTVTTPGEVTISKANYAISAQYGGATSHPELTLPQLAD